VAAIGTQGSQATFGNILRNFAARFPEKKVKANPVKSVATFLIVSFACLSQTLAVLRPLFPIKPEPPFANKDGKQ
jgi:hypothetical protein